MNKILFTHHHAKKKSKFVLSPRMSFVMNQLITSTQNPLVKQLLLLREKARERKKQGLFLVEGIREIQLALQAGYPISSLIWCRSIAGDIPALLQNLFSEPEMVTEVSEHVFNRLAVRNDNGGLIAILKPILHRLDDLRLPGNPLLLVLESVEKPGNLGAMLRTADAAGIHGIIVCDPGTDLYNPNTIRASLGTLFSNQLAVTSTPEALLWLNKKGIVTFAAALPASIPYDQADFTGPSAIVMGSEAAGLSSEWLTKSRVAIKIPMHGKADSLNVSTSAAILIFEAVRQRKCLLSDRS